MATSPTTIDDERLRRMATGAMSDMVCMHSPPQFWLRAEGKHYDALLAALLDNPDAIERLSEELAESSERLLQLIDLVGDQIEAK